MTSDQIVSVSLIWQLGHEEQERTCLLQPRNDDRSAALLRQVQCVVFPSPSQQLHGFLMIQGWVTGALKFPSNASRASSMLIFMAAWATAEQEAANSFCILL